MLTYCNDEGPLRQNLQPTVQLYCSLEKSVQESRKKYTKIWVGFTSPKGRSASRLVSACLDQDPDLRKYEATFKRPSENKSSLKFSIRLNLFEYCDMIKDFIREKNSHFFYCVSAKVCFKFNTFS